MDNLFASELFRIIRYSYIRLHIPCTTYILFIAHIQTYKPICALGQGTGHGRGEKTRATGSHCNIKHEKRVKKDVKRKRNKLLPYAKAFHGQWSAVECHIFMECHHLVLLELYSAALYMPHIFSFSHSLSH